MSLFLAEMANPIQPIRMVADPSGGEPLYVLYVTLRQWHDFYTSSSGKGLVAMLAAAMERSKAGTTPIFRGRGDGAAFWPSPIRACRSASNPGQHRQGVCGQPTTGAEVDKAAGTLIDRAALGGGCGSANAFGSGEQGDPSGMHEKKEDHDNSTEILPSTGSPACKKIRFKQRNGNNIQDHGCMALGYRRQRRRALIHLPERGG